MMLDGLVQTRELLVALDFDGTLAPLVDVPIEARMAPSTAAAIDALAAAPRTTVAFVSGRSLADLRVIAEHGDASSIVLAGSHGAEFWWPEHLRAVPAAEPRAGADESELRDELRAAAEEIAADVDGAWIEPKAVGFGVHSRLVAPERAAEVHERIDALMADRAPHWRRRVGHSITEFAFRDEGKDDAVARLREATGATAVLFAGDDVTDEDAIRSLGPDDLGVRVGPGETAASLRVASIDELAVLLRELAHRRSVTRE